MQGTAPCSLPPGGLLHPNPYPRKQRILHVFNAGESVRQAWLLALPHFGRVLYPNMGRVKIPYCAHDQ